MKRHLIVVSLIVALALLLGACAPARTPIPAKETVVVKQTVGVPVTVTPAPAAAPVVTISFWHTYGEGGNEAKVRQLDEIIATFQKAHPNVKVQHQSVRHDDFRQKLLTAIAGGTAPDLARLDIAWTPELAKLGALAPLDTLMKDFGDYKAKVFPGPLSTNAWQGHYYGLPLDTNTRTLLWNSEVYAKAGLTEPPKTIDQFLAACAKIKTAANVPGFADGGTYGWAVMPWIWSFGGDITDPEMTKATGYLNGPNTVAAYQFLKDMLDKGYLDRGILGGGPDLSGAFARDQVASLLEGPWIPAIFASQYPNKKINWAPMPTGKGGSISVVGGEDIAVFQQSKNKEAAIEFVRLMLSPEAQLGMAKVGEVPVRVDLVDQAVKAQPYMQQFLTQLTTARARLPHPNWPRIEEILSDAGQTILRGEKPPQAALDQAAAKVDALLK